MRTLPFLILSIASLGCQRPSVKKHAEFIEPLPAPILTLDPACAHDTDSMQVVREVFEPLFKITPEGKVEPHLVSTYTVSSNQKIFTLNLRSNILFHHQKELTAEDVKWTIQRNLNLPFHNDKTKNIFKHLIKIDVISKYIITFIFDQPKPYFICQLTTLNAAPMAQGSAPLGKTITKPEQMIGTGPYRIDQYHPNTLVQLKAFDLYYGQKSKIQRIKRPVITDPQVRLNLFRKKKADKTMIPRLMIEAVKNSKELSSYYKILPRLSTSYLAVGLNGHPSLKEKRLRKSLLEWIHLDSLTEEITMKTSTLAKNLVPYKIPDYNYADSFPIQYSKNLEVLLCKKGYSAERPLILKIFFRTDNVNQQRIAEILAREWNKCTGLKIELRPCQRYKFHSAKETEKMDLFMTRWLADYPDPQNGLECFTRNNPQNYCGFDDPHYDSLLHKATFTPDKKKRYQICREAEKYLLDQGIIFPLTHDSEVELIQSYIEGFKTNPIFDLSYNVLSFEEGSGGHKN